MIKLMILIMPVIVSVGHHSYDHHRCGMVVAVAMIMVAVVIITITTINIMNIDRHVSCRT